MAAKTAFDLQAEIGVNLAGFDRDLTKADQMWTKHASNVKQHSDEYERSVSQTLMRTASQLNSTEVFKGTLLADAVGRAVEIGIAKLEQLYDQLKKIKDVAEQTGASPTSIQGTMDAGAARGLSTAAFTSGAEKLADLLNDARKNASTLTELFKENGVAIKDTAGQVIPFQTALQNIAELVKNAKTEVDKIDILRAAGLSADWKDYLEGGAAALVRAANAAADPRFEELVEKADRFDKEWQRVSALMSVHMRSGLINVASDFESFFAKVRDAGTSFFGRLEGTAFDRYAKNLAAQQDAVAGKGLPARDPDRFKDFTPALALRVTPRNTPSRAPADYRADYEGGGGGGRERETAFEREKKRIRERTEELEREGRTLAMTAEQRAKARAELDLEQALRRDGVKDVSAHREEIGRLSDEYGRQAKALDELKRAQQAATQAAKYFGDPASDALSDMIVDGKSATDVAKGLAQSLARAAIQAAITGGGPLAGLFGTQGQNGAPGGLAGSLLGLLRGSGGVSAADGWSGGAAAAGFTPMATGGRFGAGQPLLVGERGPEFVQFNQGGDVFPNGTMPTIAAPSLPDIQMPSMAPAVQNNVIDQRVMGSPPVEARPNRPLAVWTGLFEMRRMPSRLAVRLARAPLLRCSTTPQSAGDDQSSKPPLMTVSLAGSRSNRLFQSAMSARRAVLSSSAMAICSWSVSRIHPVISSISSGLITPLRNKSVARP